MNQMTLELAESTIGVWARLIRTSQDLIVRVEADLKAADLPPLSWYDVLLELRRVGNEGMRPKQVQDKILLAQYNLSRLVDRLESAGYVERRADPDDGRAQLLQITPAGRDLLRKMWLVYRNAIQVNFAEKLSEKDIDRLQNILRRLQ